MVCRRSPDCVLDLGKESWDLDGGSGPTETAMSQIVSVGEQGEEATHW